MHSGARARPLDLVGAVGAGDHMGDGGAGLGVHLPKASHHRQPGEGGHVPRGLTGEERRGRVLSVGEARSTPPRRAQWRGGERRGPLAASVGAAGSRARRRGAAPPTPAAEPPRPIQRRVARPRPTTAGATAAARRRASRCRRRDRRRALRSGRRGSGEGRRAAPVGKRPPSSTHLAEGEANGPSNMAGTSAPPF